MQGGDYDCKNKRKIPADCCDDIMSLYVGRDSGKRSQSSIWISAASEGTDCRKRKLCKNMGWLEIYVSEWYISEENLEEDKK